MECFAGVAVAGGFGAKKAFDYNRENFLFDRELRLTKEFQVQKFRVEQAALWREDIRDLISLTEQKMHVYLLVNVLLLGLTLVIWCQGRLSPHTPIWLTMGYAISTTGAFMFLLLSIWMAMHAAVAAQSLETRLMTQLVRLPIPSWQEMEACRTYGSEFETIDPKQILRVPYVLNQKDLVKQEHLQLPQSTPDVDPASPTSPHAPSFDERSAGTKTADPWGLERTGHHISELGTMTGSGVAKLSHIRLARQAMMNWQSFDAFSRISMSIGVNQLLLAMSYFLMGYVFMEVGCRTSAVYGVFLLTGVAEGLIQLDMSLPRWQLRCMKVSMACGPFMAFLASYHWAHGTPEERKASELLAVAGFVSHGIFIALVTYACSEQQKHNGVFLPVAFRSVLYLDVFGWVKATLDEIEQPTNTTATDSMNSVEEPTAGSAAASRVQDGAGPAVQAIRYNEAGRPLPTRPEDMAPAGHKQNLSDLPGAPSGRRQSSCDSPFFSASNWLPGDDASDVDSTDYGNHLGHGRGSARLLPSSVFATSMLTLCAAWILAALYHSLGAAGVFSIDDTPAQWYEDDSSWLDSDSAGGRASAQGLLATNHSSGLLDMLSSAFSSVSHTSRHRNIDLERLEVSWPTANIQPQSLACDAEGKNLLVTDGLALYAAQVERTEPDAGPATFMKLLPKMMRQTARTARAVFKEAPCTGMVGEGLQDAAIACKNKGKDCAALVLHRHGGRLASCRLSGKPGPAFIANISGAWLEQLRSKGPGNPGGHHARFEKAIAVSHDANCLRDISDESGWVKCALLGTTQGRVVRLERRESDGVLLPVHSLKDGLDVEEPSWGPGAVRQLDSRHLGVVSKGGRSILVLDGLHGSKSRGKLDLPEASFASAGFCSGGGHVFMLGQGPSPSIWRLRLPEELAAAAQAASST